MTTSITPIAEELGQREKAVELGDLDLDSAKLDDMVQALGRLELEKRGLLENIRVLRLRLADEKVAYRLPTIRVRVTWFQFLP